MRYKHLKKIKVSIMKPFRRIINDVIHYTLIKAAYNNYIGHMDTVKLLKYAFFQRIVGINRSVPWPVHFTSTVENWNKIAIGQYVSPGASPGCYINGACGITFGTNVWIGPNVVIVSANHDINDYDKYTESEPVKIGNNVWIGANCVILPGITIGDNVVIGASSLVTHNIPANSIAAGNICRVVREKAPYQGKKYSE
jgi:acetyltransferase-like isoleucine patch superfamily enzyme